MKSSLRYLWAYSAGDEWTRAWHNRLIEQRRQQGYDVEGFCVTPPSLDGRWLPFPELHYRWRTGDSALMQMYLALAESLEERDVLILYNGANLHPDFVSWLKVLKVYTAGDDPESTEILTKPAAPAFDVHLINNVACIDMYRSWGLKNVYFWPLGSIAGEEDVADLDAETALDVSARSIPAVYIGDCNGLKRERLRVLSKAFPKALCAGKGWRRGFVGWSEMWSAYRQSQIGWNIHNSSGPINFRLYDLAAHGVMQICDNKSHLNYIYEDGKEAVGFDSIDQCIELTQYYLAHPEEQRQIAYAGWRRWRQDYTPLRVWQRLVSIAEAHKSDFSNASAASTVSVSLKIRRHAKRAVLRHCAARSLSTLRRYSERIRNSHNI